MVRNEFTFPSADGKTGIHAVEWRPDESPKATARGFLVVGHDHIGHGSSVAPDSPPLYFGPKGSWKWVVDDIYALRQQIGKQYPSLPYFLLGHSMGSFLARTYLIRYPGTLDGAVIMGTGQMAPALLAGGKAVAIAEGKRIGEDQTSPLVTKLSFGTYNKLFAPNRTAFDWLSVNEANVDAYIADPLCGGNASIGLFREMLGGMSFIAKAENLKQMNLNTPILFISGGMDPVGDCGKGVMRAYESFRKAGVRDVSVKLYPDLRHEILCETEKETVFEDVLHWLEETIAKQA